MGASEARWNACVHPCTWRHGKTSQPVSYCWSVAPICFPSSSWSRPTPLFKIICLFFKQQPVWWSTDWGCGRLEFNTLLTLRGSIKHFPTLEKMILNYENSSRNDYCSMYHQWKLSAVTQIRTQLKFLCKSLWLQSGL